MAASFAGINGATVWSSVYRKEREGFVGEGASKMAAICVFLFNPILFIQIKEAAI